MGNEMGNRNVSGLQEEDKAVGEETEKNLVGGDCEGEVKGENHIVPDVKDKDFHEKFDDLSGGEHEILGDEDYVVEKQMMDEKGRPNNDTDELKLSSQSVEIQVSNEAGGDKQILDSNFEANKLNEDQITNEREGTEKESTIVDSTSSSSSSKQEKCEDDSVGNRGTDSKEELMGLNQEPKLLTKSTTQEESSKDANIDEGGNDSIVSPLNSPQEVSGKDVNVDEGGNGLIVSPLDSPQEVCDSLMAQENELIAKYVAPEEEKKVEVASLGDEVIGFPPVGSLHSLKEVCEPLENLTDRPQEPEIFFKEKAAQEESSDTTTVGEEGIGFSLDSSQEACESQQELIDPIQDPDSLVKEAPAQEETCKVERLDINDNSSLVAGSQDSCEEVSEPQDISIVLPPEGKCDDGNGSPTVGCQEVCETQEKTIGPTQEAESGTQEEKHGVSSVDEEENSYPVIGSIDSSPTLLISQEVCEKHEVNSVDEEENSCTMIGSIDSSSILQTSQEVCEKHEVNGVDEEENNYPMIGSIDSSSTLQTSQEVCEKHEVNGVDEEENNYPMIGSIDSSSTLLTSQEVCEKHEVNGVDEEENSYPVIGSLDSSQEVCEKHDKEFGLGQETDLIVKECGSPEDECGIESVDEANDSPVSGFIKSSQEVSKLQEVTPIVHKVVTETTESTVTNNNIVENKSTEEIVTGNVSQFPHKGENIPSPDGEKVNSSKNPVSTIVGRKFPSFEFDLSLEARRSQDSDRTPLLCHDKAATRSLSSQGQQSYRYSKVPLEDEAVSVEEKTIMMERSYSEKSNAPYMSLKKKDENGTSVTNLAKEEGDVSGYKKVEKEAILSSSKGSNGKRKSMSSFFATCICCDVSIH